MKNLGAVQGHPRTSAARISARRRLEETPEGRGSDSGAYWYVRADTRCVQCIVPDASPAFRSSLTITI